MNEAQLHERNCFLTLTYNDETLASRRLGWEPTVPYTPPSEGASSEDTEDTYVPSSKTRKNEDSLRPRDAQLFMKRLRDNLTRRGLAKVRFYLVGEYGELYKRPHYHVALFGEDFSDDRIYWRTSGDHKCYRSSRLEELWPHGNSEIGELTIDSAAYVASYVLKKVNGKMADEHYRRETPDGQTFWIAPEFALMSRRPGIGKAWFDKYHEDVYPQDHVIHDGRKLKPPRYYDKLMELMDPGKIAMTKLLREERAKELADDNTNARLMDKETVLKAKLKLKNKPLE